MTVIRGSVYTLLAQVLGAASTALLGIFVARELGVGGFGTYALVLALTMLVAPLADFGISLAVARMLAAGSDAERDAVYVTGLALKVVTAVVFGLALFALAPVLSRIYPSHSAATVFRAGAVAVTGQTLLTFFWSTLIAERRGLLNLGIVGVRVVLEVTLTVGLLLNGHGPAAATVARGGAHCFAAILAAGLVLRRTASSRIVPSSARDILKAARSLAVVETSYAALYQVDALMVGAFLTPAAVGVYQAPLRVMTPVTYIGVALASGLAPSVARERNDITRRTQVARVLATLAFVEAAIAAVIFARADDIVALLGPDFHQSAGVLRALAPYFFVAAMAPVVSMLVTYVGNVRHRAIVGLSCLALNICLDCIFIPVFGVNGAAIAADLAAIAFVGAHCWLVSRALGFRGAWLLGLGMRAAATAPLIAVLLVVANASDLLPSAVARFSLVAAAGGLSLFLVSVIAPREVRRLVVPGGRP